MQGTGIILNLTGADRYLYACKAKEIEMGKNMQFVILHFRRKKILCAFGQNALEFFAGIR